MSRLTGKEVYSLMEAYQAVYTPQELTEEQVWEGVENWVQSLLEEGYDLSDYTWEEMYESYLEEMGDPGGNRPGQQSTTRGAVTMYAQPRPNTGEPTQSRFDRPMNAGTSQRTGSRGTVVSRPQIGGLPTSYRGDELQQAARARASQVGTSRQGTAGGPTVGGNTPIGPSPTPETPRPGLPKVNQRPGAPVPPVRPVVPSTPSNGNGPKVIQRPGAPAPRPAATPDSKMGGDPMDQWARANPTLAAKVKPGSSGYNTIKARLDADNDRQENYDAYDLVFSYLINEGYANTQDSALAIMANMSEDWKLSIIEAKKTTDDDMAKGDLYSAMFRRDKKVKGAKYDDSSANKYLNMKNAKDRQKRYDDDMGKVHTDRRPSR